MTVWERKLRFLQSSIGARFSPVPGAWQDNAPIRADLFGTQRHCQIKQTGPPSSVRSFTLSVKLHLLLDCYQAARREGSRISVSTKPSNRALKRTERRKKCVQRNHEGLTDVRI